MRKKLLPVFYSVNFDGTMYCENGITGRRVNYKNIQLLASGERVVLELPKDKSQYLFAETEVTEANVALFDINTKNRRGERHTADLGVISSTQ